ncbi:hypothetical protein [Aeromonas veronii]|uniref:hypothetical protein n=1 Tax=Aeromonas veronii TaxID=654 RepID=UPI0036726045
MQSITMTEIWQWVTAVVLPAFGTLLWSYRNEIKELVEYKVRTEVQIENMKEEMTELKQNQIDIRAEIRDEIRAVGQDIKADMAALRADIKRGS